MSSSYLYITAGIPVSPIDDVFFPWRLGIAVERRRVSLKGETLEETSRCHLPTCTSSRLDGWVGKYLSRLAVTSSLSDDIWALQRR